MILFDDRSGLQKIQTIVDENQPLPNLILMVEKDIIG
jgi:hypothetical protein